MNRIIIISVEEDDGVGLYAKRLKEILEDRNVVILSKKHFNRWLNMKNIFFKLFIFVSHFSIRAILFCIKQTILINLDYGCKLSIPLPGIRRYLQENINSNDTIIIFSLYKFISERQIADICVREKISPIYYPLDMEHLSACFSFRPDKSYFFIDGLKYPTRMFFLKWFIKYIHKQKLLSRRKMKARVVVPSKYVKSLISFSPCFVNLPISSLIYLAVPAPPKSNFKRDSNSIILENTIHLVFLAFDLRDNRKGYNLLCRAIRALDRDSIIKRKVSHINLHLIGKSMNVYLPKTSFIKYHFSDFLNISELYKILANSIYLSLSVDDFGPTMLSIASVSAKYILSTDMGTANELKNMGYPISLVKDENDIRDWLRNYSSELLSTTNYPEFKNSPLNSNIVKSQWDKILADSNRAYENEDII